MPTASRIPKRSPIQVLTGPDAVWLRGADETRFVQRGMAVDIEAAQHRVFILYIFFVFIINCFFHCSFENRIIKIYESFNSIQFNSIHLFFFLFLLQGRKCKYFSWKLKNLYISNRITVRRDIMPITARRLMDPSTNGIWPSSDRPMNPPPTTDWWPGRVDVESDKFLPTDNHTTAVVTVIARLRLPRVRSSISGYSSADGAFTVIRYFTNTHFQIEGIVSDQVQPIFNNIARKYRNQISISISFPISPGWH